MLYPRRHTHSGWIRVCGVVVGFVCFRNFVLVVLILSFCSCFRLRLCCLLFTSSFVKPFVCSTLCQWPKKTCFVVLIVLASALSKFDVTSSWGSLQATDTRISIYIWEKSCVSPAGEVRGETGGYAQQARLLRRLLHIVNTPLWHLHQMDAIDKIRCSKLLWAGRCGDVPRGLAWYNQHMKVHSKHPFWGNIFSMHGSTCFPNTWGKTKWISLCGPTQELIRYLIICRAGTSQLCQDSLNTFFHTPLRRKNAHELNLGVVRWALCGE